MSDVKQGRQLFTDYEKSIIFDLVRPRIDIIDSKKNDSNAIHKKRLAWQSIATEFNAMGNVKKYTDKQLKKCWQNIKTRAKGPIQNEKKARPAIEGGPPVYEADEMSQKIYKVIPEQFEPLQNNLDDDSDMFFTETQSNLEHGTGMFVISCKCYKNCLNNGIASPRSSSGSNVGQTLRTGKIQGNKRDSSKLESFLLESQRIEHELKVKKLKLEIECIKREHEYVEREHKAKMALYESSIIVD